MVATNTDPVPTLPEWSICLPLVVNSEGIDHPRPFATTRQANMR